MAEGRQVGEHDLAYRRREVHLFGDGDEAHTGFLQLLQVFQGDSGVPGEPVKLVDHQDVPPSGQRVINHLPEQRALRHVISMGRYSFVDVFLVDVPALALRVGPDRSLLGVQAVALDLFFVADPGV